MVASLEQARSLAGRLNTAQDDQFAAVAERTSALATLVQHDLAVWAGEVRQLIVEKMLLQQQVHSYPPRLQSQQSLKHLSLAMQTGRMERSFAGGVLRCHSPRIAAQQALCNLSVAVCCGNV